MKNLILSIFISCAFSAHAQTNTASYQSAKHPLSFIENKGQVTDQYGNQRQDIQFKTGDKGVSVFIGNGQLHYQFSKIRKPADVPVQKGKFAAPDSTPVQYDMYRLDVMLEGADAHAAVITEEKQAYYENYHTAALDNGNAVAHAYNRITYKNIYPNIDWRLYIKDNGLEYDFIVYPGGDINDIKIKYSGATDIEMVGGNIKVTTPMGTITERQLYAYELNTLQPISAQFKLHGHTLGFSAQTKYKGTLIIDPHLVWATYYGGTGKEQANATTCDKFGNVYITGRTSSLANIATIGSHQLVYGGWEDVFLAKFTGATGARQWATYYGGNGPDDGYSVACDNAGNVYITGRAGSTNGIATAGAYKPTSAGYYYAFLAKFNSAGAIQWGTYYGGNQGALGYGVACDGDNAYLCGYTASTDSIATPGGYQDTFGGQSSGVNNAFVAKFSSNGALVWGTYFGQDGEGSAAFACAVDAAKNIYITGEAFDTGIVTTPGCHQDTCRSQRDCFIAKFDSSCHLLWSTYFGGDDADIAEGIACDDSLAVYITGETYSANDFVTPGAWQSVYNSGYTDAFLAKFSGTGVLQWSTYYGGSTLEVPQGVACDHSGNVFIAGYTNSTDKIATPGSLYDTYQGGVFDAYLARFTNGGNLLWSTYYGGSLGDGFCGVACDGGRSVYAVGAAGSMSGIATPGAWQPELADSGDVMIVKLDTGTTGISSTASLFKSVSLYPNPNNGVFTISASIPGHTGDAVDMEVVNVLGQIIYTGTVTVQNGILKKEVRVQGIAAGNYLLKLSINSEQQVIKFTVR